MTDPSAVADDAVAALYRRFRPGRFAELRGQEHVVRALQGAVRADRVVHAYLFSGPRGTGKTTTARILAKALNCENPVDGDACGVCASCVSITRGTSLDVVELDAASNNGVDDVREITAGAWHGTPGRWKVYIVDEVHQLSKSAAAALLKTLEEPPHHVVFVLATTDPHKVLPTIRSRTQHLEFRLISGETLHGLLRDVRDAAHLGVDEATLESAVRLGRGSARDALSALDQLVATGGATESRPSLDDLEDSLADGDATRCLVALSRLTADGWDPEQLGEELAAEARQAFLLQIAPEVADVVDVERARLSAWGARLGLARTVRVLETLGRALRDTRSAPDKGVVLEVALVRLVRPDLDATIESLDERVTRLEHAATRPIPLAPTPVERRPIGAPPPPTPVVPVKSTDSATSTNPEPPSTRPVATGDEDEWRRRFTDRVVPRTSRAAQLVLRAAEVRGIQAGQVTLAVASEEIRQGSDKVGPSLRAALEHEFGGSWAVEWVVDARVAAAPPVVRPRRSAPPPASAEDASVDVGPDGVGGPDEEVVVVDSAAAHLIAEMFPGAEELP